MMKKSLLATLLAGLVTLGAVASDEPHMMKLKVERMDNGPTVLNIEQNGSDFVFEFTESELQDEARLAERLQELDEKTRKAVITALLGISEGKGMIFIDEDEVHMNSEDENKVVIVKEFKYETDGSDDGKHVVIKIDGAADGHVTKEFVEAVDGRGFKFRIGSGEQNVSVHHGGTKIHHDSQHAAKVIEKLLKNSDLTPEQIEKLQRLLDQKR